MTDEHGDLGLSRPLTRRDFMNGVAVGIAGSAMHGALPAFAQEPASGSEPVGYYPPVRVGLRGDYPAAIDTFDAIRRGKYALFPVPEPEILEEYDLIIVGAGISGLSAAYFYRAALGSGTKILILDNHDDFGGHAKRNEFHYGGQTYLGFGGTMGIATPYPYSYTAKSLIEDLGIQVDRYPEFVNHTLQTNYKLSSAMFFDKEHFKDDSLVLGHGRLPWKQFFAKVPLSDRARQDLIRIHGKNPDYMPGMSVAQKKAKLATISYQQYLLKYAKIDPEAIAFFLGDGERNNKRVDTLPALEAAEHDAVGFNGLGLDSPESFNEGSYFFHFPDGNASVARLLVGKLIPAAYASPQSMSTILQSQIAYSQLDVPESKLKIRLSSPVVRVQSLQSHDKRSGVQVAYLQNGKLRAAKSRYCILACYNRLIPSLLPELSKSQQEALAYPVKVPMLYTNVLLKRWTAFQKLGVDRINAPGMFYSYTSLEPGITIGGYRGVSTPDHPVLITMIRNPNKPGLPRKEQNRIGQQELLTMSFEQHEIEIRKQLTRMLGAGGFSAAEDIAAITVNRWPYGYAYTYDTLADPEIAPELRPHILGRKRFGNITIANADAGAAAFTNQAIDEANRAVQELLVLQGLT